MKASILPALMVLGLGWLTLSPGSAVFAQEKKAEEGWTDLFDGKTTEGWTPREEVVSFESKEGVLHLLSKKNVWVVSEKTMKDFVFEGEVKLPEDAEETGFNSGLAFRCVGAKGKPKGYQVEVDLKQPGAVYGIGLGGWLYPKSGAEKKAYAEAIKDVFKPGEFNRFKVEAIGPKIRTWVNGKLISEIESVGSLEGYFGIQHHGKGGTVQFRGLRVKALNGE